MPIRVLQVVNYMNRGGLETMLMNYYRHIDRAKIQFDFLVHRDFEADYDKEILSLGGKIYHLPRLNPFSPAYCSRLSSFFEEHKEYRIVHSHLDCMAGIPLKAAKAKGVPFCIAHAHNKNQEKNLKYPLKLLYKRMIPKYADRLFACGEEAGKWMFGGAPFSVLRNAIDAEAYRFDKEQRKYIRTALKIPDDVMLIGHVGRFAVQKNHSFLLRVFASMNQRDPHTRLLLVGEGNLMERIREEAEYLEIAENVIFAGSRGDVPKLMQAMDLFLFPSLFEGLPLTVVEAQAAGLPCLMSKGVPEECVLVPELVRRMPLEEGTEAWAEAALQHVRTKRMDAFKHICNSGYDVLDNTQRLERFYLEHWEPLRKSQLIGMP